MRRSIKAQVSRELGSLSYAASNKESLAVSRKSECIVQGAAEFDHEVMHGIRDLQRPMAVNEGAESGVTYTGHSAHRRVSERTQCPRGNPEVDIPSYEDNG